MSFPRITHCMVCEDVRAERGNKSTILGFYGITPDVEIAVADLKKPVDRLMFVLLVESFEGPRAYRATLHLIDEQQLAIIKSPELSIQVPDKRDVVSVFAFGTAQVVFGRPGKFTFKLFIDDQEHYKTTFRVRTAKPGELA